MDSASYKGCVAERSSPHPSQVSRDPRRIGRRQKWMCARWMRRSVLTPIPYSTLPLGVAYLATLTTTLPKTTTTTTKHTQRLTQNNKTRLPKTKQNKTENTHKIAKQTTKPHTRMQSVCVCVSVSVPRKRFVGNCCFRYENASRVNVIDLDLHLRSHRS